MTVKYTIYFKLGKKTFENNLRSKAFEFHYGLALESRLLPLFWFKMALPKGLSGILSQSHFEAVLDSKILNTFEFSATP